MYLKSTQGDPIYYKYGVVRLWAAELLGLTYSMGDQYRDFFDSTEPLLNDGTGSWQGRAETFDMLFRGDHKKVRNGEKPSYIPLDLLLDMDIYYSRQPRQLQPILAG